MKAPSPVLLMTRALGLGGTERQLTEVARFLDRTRFTPYVCCFVADGLRKAEIEQSGVPLLRLPVSSFLKPSALGGAWQLGAFIRSHGIRIVHTFDVPMNLFGTLPARLAGTPVVLSSQRAHRQLTPPAGRRLLRIVDRIVDGVVVNCKAMSEHLRVDEGVPASRIFVCPNGIDTSIFHPSGIQRPALLNNDVIIGVVCALRLEKGLSTLLDGLALLRLEFPGVKLVVVGSGPDEARLRTRASAIGIEDRMHFEPATRDVARWLRSMDIFVMPSLSEALSNSLMEAMACGCCPVASRVGGNPELVTHGENGLLFDAGNAEALAVQLRLLIQNVELRHRYGDTSARRIATEFTEEAAAKRMAEIYEFNLRRKISDKRAAFEAS